MATKQDISAEFPFKSEFIEVHGSKIHYVDEGSGEPILFLHGNPTSSYQWRNIIPHVKSVGRCIAMDLIGMGKSDKPDIEYRFFDHVRYVEGFIEKMGLRNITFLFHDWGSALGFHYAMRHESNVKGLAFYEAILKPRESWSEMAESARELFQAFRTPGVGWEMIVGQNLFIERRLPEGIVRKLSQREMDCYRAPFREPSSRKPLWRWPNELPIEGDPPDVVEAVENYSRWLQQSELPKLLFYGTPGVIIGQQMVDWCTQKLKNLKLVNVGQGLHHLPEDHPHLMGAELAKWYTALDESGGAAIMHK